MAVEIGALRALLSLDSAAFERGVKRAQASMGGLERGLSQAANRMGSIGRRMSAAITLPLAAATTLLMRSSLQNVDAQAKLAQSLGTSVASIQTLERAGELAGVSMSGIEQATKDLTRRLSQAAAGTGPAVDALGRLGLSANELMQMPLDERVKAINSAIEQFVPAAQRAAVAGQLFGEEGSIAMSRVDATTIERAREELEKFGVTVSDLDADKIEDANDAMSSLGLVSRGLGNQIAVALAPALRALAEGIASVAGWFADLSPSMKQIIGVTAAVAAAIGPLAIGLSLVASGLAVAIGAVSSFTAVLITLRGALLATGIGALIVGAGMLVDFLIRLRTATGSWGAALEALGDLASGVWEGIKASAASIAPALGSVWATIQAAFYSMLEGISLRWSRFLGNLGADLANVPLLGDFSDSLLRSSREAFAGMSELNGIAQAAENSASRLKAEAAALASQGFDKARDAADRLREILSTEIEASDEATRSAQDLSGALDEIGGTEGGGSAGRAASGINKVKDATDDARKAQEEWATTMAGHFDGLITGGKGLSGVLNSMARQFESQGWQQLFGALSGGFTKKPSGGGGLFSGITSFIGGLFGGFRATGGPVAAGTSYVVGERGPELFTPKSSGAIIPNGSFGGGRTAIDLNVYVDDDGRLAAIAQQNGAQAGAAVAVRVVQSQGPAMAAQAADKQARMG